jgi:hypothetical protein
MNQLKISTVLVSLGVTAAISLAGIAYLNPESSPDKQFSRHSPLSFCPPFSRVKKKTSRRVPGGLD